MAGYLTLDGDGVVTGAANVPPGTEVDDATYASACGRVGACRLSNGALQAYAPPAATIAPYGALPTVTGNQWAFALSDMGLSSAWQVGVAKSKASDQVRVGLIARDTPLVAADPLLIRIAANAGADGSGDALVSVPAVFAHAQGMPT